MKIFRKFFVMMVVYATQCFSIDNNILIEAIEHQNISEVINFFDEIKSITWEEANELITQRI